MHRKDSSVPAPSLPELCSGVQPLFFIRTQAAHTAVTGQHCPLSSHVYLLTVTPNGHLDLDTWSEHHTCMDLARGLFPY